MKAALFGILSALTASACCLGPVVLVLAGLGSLGFGTLRPLPLVVPRGGDYSADRCVAWNTLVENILSGELATLWVGHTVVGSLAVSSR